MRPEGGKCCRKCFRVRNPVKMRQALPVCGALARDLRGPDFKKFNLAVLARARFQPCCASFAGGDCFKQLFCCFIGARRQAVGNTAVTIDAGLGRFFAVLHFPDKRVVLISGA